MWTSENRGRYERSRLRYPSDLTDEDWALVEPLIPPAKRGGNPAIARLFADETVVPVLDPAAPCRSCRLPDYCRILRPS